MTRSAKENLSAWRLLLAVKDRGGLSEAGFALGLDTAQCSRLIRRLEDELGFALLDHEHRPCRLTREACRIVPSAREFLFAHEHLLQVCAAASDQPMRVKFGIPVNIPRFDSYSIIKNYEAKDPGLRAEIIADADHEDVCNGRVDAAYLPYRPQEASLLIWSIAEMCNCLLASPAYIRERGLPTSPSDLAEHDVIVRSGRHYPATNTLTNDLVEVPLACRRVAFSGDVASCREAALAGAGIALDLSFHTMRAEIDSGRLVAVLPGWHRPNWSTCLAISRKNASNVRLVGFCRWFAAEEAKAARARYAQVRSFVRSLLTSRPLSPPADA